MERREGNREGKGEGEGDGRGFSWPTHSFLCTLLLLKFVVATERLLLFKFSQMLQEFFRGSLSRFSLRL